MKSFFLLFLFGTLALFTPKDSLAQPYGSEGNRATGVVYKGDKGKPFEKGEAVVEILKREQENNDRSNDDGVYYLVVPTDIQKYQLVYRAEGYWSQTSRYPIENNHDPEKVEKVTLRKKDPPKDSRNLRELFMLLQAEQAIYKETSSENTRAAIKSDLMRFLNELRVKGLDPNAIGMVEQALDRMR